MRANKWARYDGATTFQAATRLGLEPLIWRPYPGNLS